MHQQKEHALALIREAIASARTLLANPYRPSHFDPSAAERLLLRAEEDVLAGDISHAEEMIRRLDKLLNAPQVLS